MRKYFRIFKRTLTVLFFLLLSWSIFNISLILYGYDQLRGQLQIVAKARPVVEVLADTAISDTVKSRLQFIEHIKTFAIDSLGLKVSDNYTTFYDQGNKPLLWVLTVSEPFSLKPYQWHFPFLGFVSYKGFFNYEDGLQEQRQMYASGYDTEYGDVSAWSTLGWFTDPILSGMLRRGDGQLAELIIHEMTHATLYLKSNVDLNENMASVCGEVGAMRFLEHQFGKESAEVKDYLSKKEDYDLFARFMLNGTSKLDSLYLSMADSSIIVKRALKELLIRQLVKSLDTVQFHSSSRFKNIFENELPNNAYFLNFVRYDSRKTELKKQLTVEFNGDIRKFLDYLKETNGEIKKEN